MVSTKENQIAQLKDKVDKFDNQIKEMTLDSMNAAPKEDYAEPKISQKQLENNDLYIKPKTWIADNQKFNPKFEDDYKFASEYVQCIPIHNELKGEIIELWTHPFGGKGAAFWQIPSDRPVWVPRYVAEQLTKCKYHRLKMDESKMISNDGSTTMYGQMIAQTTIQRLDALPVSSKRSIFMGKAA